MADENHHGDDADLNTLVDEFIKHKEMELLQSYLSRGRRFKDTDTDDLKDIWATAFKIYVRSRSREGRRDSHDAEVELRLRGLDVPNELVRDEQEIARRIIEREYPNDPQWHAELKQEIKEYFESSQKPKN